MPTANRLSEARQGWRAGMSPARRTAAITQVFPNRDQQGAALAQTTTVTRISDSRFTIRRRS